MTFTCKICKNEISFPESDHNFYQKLGWECTNCYSVIAKKRYPVNIKNGLTVFTTMGESLGDTIMSSIIKERYLIDNTDENIIFLTNETRYDYKNYDYDKLFWANQFSDTKDKMPVDDKTYWLAVTTECCEFARKGYYPEYRIKGDEFLKPDYEYIVMHLRNIQKGISKNINPALVYIILNKLKQYDYRIIIVGNDNIDEYLSLETLKYMIDDEIIIYDFRNILTLDEIAFYCRYAELFMGTDSGIAHLAAASGCKKILSWNYITQNWFPKTKNKLISYTKIESTTRNIILGLNKFLS